MGHVHPNPLACAFYHSPTTEASFFHCIYKLLPRHLRGCIAMECNRINNAYPDTLACASYHSPATFTAESTDLSACSYAVTAKGR